MYKCDRKTILPRGMLIENSSPRKTLLRRRKTKISRENKWTKFRTMLGNMKIVSLWDFKLQEDKPKWSRGKIIKVRRKVQPFGKVTLSAEKSLGASINSE